jgi:hypothetical protein
VFPQGTNTFDRYEMRIYKRVIDFDTSVETIRTLVSILSVHAHSIVSSCFAFILEFKMQLQNSSAVRLTPFLQTKSMAIDPSVQVEVKLPA